MPGVEHSNTLESMAELALTWKSLGRHAAALNLLRDSLTKRKQLLGPHHHVVLSSSEILLQYETEGSEEQ
jgi:hypothetical protein